MGGSFLKQPTRYIVILAMAYYPEKDIWLDRLSGVIFEYSIGIYHDVSITICGTVALRSEFALPDGINSPINSQSSCCRAHTALLWCKKEYGRGPARWNIWFLRTSPYMAGPHSIIWRFLKNYSQCLFWKWLCLLATGRIPASLA